MTRRRIVLFACALAALAAPGAARAGSGLFVGAGENAPMTPDPVLAKAKVDLARLAGFDTLRVSMFWGKGRASVIPADDLLRLQNAAAAAQLDGMRLIVSVSNFNSRDTPLTAAQREEFAIYCVAIARAVPSVTDFIIGNEPNLNLFWMPQFSKPVYGWRYRKVRVHGKLVRKRVRYVKKQPKDLAAPAYESLLAGTYDYLKRFNPDINVIGVALSPRGGDNPTATGKRPTHSPITFIRDLGAAYRASGRTTPIMDAFGIHPYPETSKIGPSFMHPRSNNLGIADYAKLTKALGHAFAGTAQPGSSLPIVYDEFGTQTTIPQAQAGAYSNAGSKAAKDAVSEALQAQYYKQALTLAYCQPNVTGFLFFHVLDEPNLAAWQSGLFYANGKAKSSLDAVRAAADEVRDGTISSCASAHIAAFVQSVNIPAKTTFAADNTSWGGDLTCSKACTYTARIEQFPGGEPALATKDSIGPDQFTVFLLPAKTLPPGTYRMVVRVWQYERVGTATVRYGPPFTVAAAG